MLKEDNIYMENKTHPIIINEVKVKPMGMDENKDEYRNNLTYLNYTSYLLDDNNNIISVDDNFTKITGYTFEDIKNMNITQNDLVFEEDRDKYVNLVENAIKHGLKGIDGSKMLTLEIKTNDNKTIIEVMDNGRGFDIREQSPQYAITGTGTGLRVIQNTIDYYNKKNREEMEFTINNVKNTDGKVCGCRTTLTIPAIIKTIKLS